ncbi:MAG TPA: UDP-N-acetylmuramoyl-L-alanine--D-glutamate ligase, partial [Candidatus Binatia bacterium]|nr:UDP-N-acetylmuramoyl-L-alanine--D-glutamate ligase [Candidatus Binatia bacterium]
VLFGELATRLESLLEAQGQRIAKVERVQTLPEAVACAAQLARPGDVVLLSPGGTSYDAYKDFEERGEQFRRLVKGLEQSRS